MQEKREESRKSGSLYIPSSPSPVEPRYDDIVFAGIFNGADDG